MQHKKITWKVNNEMHYWLCAALSYTTYNDQNQLIVFHFDLFDPLNLTAKYSSEKQAMGIPE